MPESLSVLIAPLNWGLGHATRCVPIIKKYINQGHRVIIAADGDALLWLQREFPKIQTIHLPDIQIRYSEKSSQVVAILKHLPHILTGIYREHQALKKIIANEHIDLVISDNRFGLWNKSVKSVYITHQLMIKSPIRTLEPILRLIHKQIILKYDECWIPDIEGEGNLSGDLSHRYPPPPNAHFIGWLSRFPVTLSVVPEKNYTNFCLLSGPEPHRTIFEQKMIEKFKDAVDSTLIVQGKPGFAPSTNTVKNIDIISYLSDEKIQYYLQNTPNIFCRSGYSTLMDLKILNCKANLTPTPGQTEQEYLAQLHAL